jgi:hypothetical protein
MTRKSQLNPVVTCSCPISPNTTTYNNIKRAVNPYLKKGLISDKFRKKSDKGDLYNHTHWDKANHNHRFMKVGNSFPVLQIFWYASPKTTSEIEEISVLVIGKTQ